jgi:hypothetical protein
MFQANLLFFLSSVHHIHKVIILKFRIIKMNLMKKVTGPWKNFRVGHDISSAYIFDQIFFQTFFSSFRVEYPDNEK